MVSTQMQGYSERRGGKPGFADGSRGSMAFTPVRCGRRKGRQRSTGDGTGATLRGASGGVQEAD